MGVIVLMMLLTLSVSMVAIILAAVAMSQASRAARAAGGPGLADGDMQKISQAVEKIDALGSRMDQLQASAGETAGRLDKLEAGLSAAEQEIQNDAASLAEINENLVHFKEFQSIVESAHRRISDAFSFTHDEEAGHVDRSADEGLAEPEEGPIDSDSDDDSIRPAGEYDDHIID